ncbi:MAG: hypothetical protein K0S01_2429 [Herbinix sp.]|nr:hypothetical protein [Herbinix sp.]
MKVNGLFVFMGAERSMSRDGKEEYLKIGLMQGLSSQVFYPDKVMFAKLENVPVATTVAVELTIKTVKEKTYYELNDVRVITDVKQGMKAS